MITSYTPLPGTIPFTSGICSMWILHFFLDIRQV